MFIFLWLFRLFRHVGVAWCVAGLITAGLTTATANAGQKAPLSLAEAERMALTEEPGVRALLARADALKAQSVVAGQLPDPKLRIGMANFPIESGGFTTEGMTQAQIGIRQVFPPGHTRAMRTGQFKSLAAELAESADSRARDVRLAVRSAWLEAHYWTRAWTIVNESRPFFSDLVTVTRSLYAVGRKGQQDVLRADLEVSRLDDRLLEMSEKRLRARAVLSQWIGSVAGRPLADELPQWEQVPDLAMLQEQLAEHPALKAADAGVEARNKGVGLAEQKYKPGWALDVGYGYRDGLLPTGEPRSDFVSVMVTLDLPLFRRNRQDRELAAALGERRAATESREELKRRLFSQLESDYAGWQELTRRIDLYEGIIIDQTEGRAEVALAAYQSEAGDFADVMRAHIDRLDTRLEHMRLQVERAQSYAVLANLGGIAP